MTTTTTTTTTTSDCGASSSFTDIDQQSWVHRFLPAAAVPYAALGRWDRPIGTWLLLWPCLWSTSLAATAGTMPDASLCALFGLGAFAMRGAGCTVNDLWDRDIDRQVERTRLRPLASGAIGVPQALGFLGAQCTVGLGVLLALPPYAVGLSFVSVPLVGLYPLAKRVTNWPQAVLGLTFNWGALVGWAAVHGACDWSVVLPLYAGGFWWTLLYDTIYAHQDKRDDAKVGPPLNGAQRVSLLAGGSRTRMLTARRTRPHGPSHRWASARRRCTWATARPHAAGSPASVARARPRSCSRE